MKIRAQDYLRLKPLLEALDVGALEMYSDTKGCWRAVDEIDLDLPADYYRVKPAVFRGWMVRLPGGGYRTHVVYEEQEELPFDTRKEAVVEVVEAAELDKVQLVNQQQKAMLAKKQAALDQVLNWCQDSSDFSHFPYSALTAANSL